MNVLTATAGFVFFSIAVLFSSYVFVFLPTLALKNKDIAKNAFILMVTGW